MTPPPTKVENDAEQQSSSKLLKRNDSEKTKKRDTTSATAADTGTNDTITNEKTKAKGSTSSTAVDKPESKAPKQATKKGKESSKEKTKKEKKGKKGLSGIFGKIMACFRPKPVPHDNEKDDKSSTSSSSSSTAQAESSEGKSKGKKSAVGKKTSSVSSHEKDKPAVETKEHANGVKHESQQASASSTSDSTTAKPSMPPITTTTNTLAQTKAPSLTIPPPPIVVTGAIHTPHTPSKSGDDDEDVIVPPTPQGSHLLPLDETEGVTSGAVVPPGATLEHPTPVPHKMSVDDSDSGTNLDEDEFHDAHEEDIEAEEARLIANGGSGIPIVDGKPKPLLPPLAERHAGRKCLVLDMDETLLHSSFKLMPTHDFTVAVEIEWQWHNAYVLKRPGVEEFLRKMGEIYEVVVYTASVSKYADPVLDKVDVHKAITHRLFRESCYHHRGNYVKDLSMLGRPLGDCIILDNSPASYLFNQNNAVPVMTWFNDPHDTELMDLVGFLTDLATAGDVRGILERPLPDLRSG